MLLLRGRFSKDNGRERLVQIVKYSVHIVIPNVKKIVKDRETCVCARTGNCNICSA